MERNDKTGFCVPYTIHATPDKGLGVFADAPILKGTILWRHVRGLYAVYDERSLKEFVAQLSRKEVVYELTHMFGLPEFPGCIIRIFDDGVLINHSRQPTTAMNNSPGDNQIPYSTSPQNVRDVADALLDDRFALIAIQDLNVGDELTMDYTISVEDPLYYDALCERYDVSEPYLENGLE
ncbi:MAG: SET domain-containing protein [Deltaproteobacteria bacterium]|nr:SET domain-containing protein [Deltaproteobacteria bacterium]